MNAKGRKLVAADYATVESIVNETGEVNYQLKDVVIAVATSDLMTSR